MMDRRYLIATFKDGIFLGLHCEGFAIGTKEDTATVYRSHKAAAEVLQRLAQQFASGGFTYKLQTLAAASW